MVDNCMLYIYIYIYKLCNIFDLLLIKVLINIGYNQCNKTILIIVNYTSKAQLLTPIIIIYVLNVDRLNKEKVIIIGAYAVCLISEA